MTRKNLTAAILAGLAGAAGLAGTAHAVNLNPDGVGEVLLYPYYTVNDGNQTLISVVNTTSQAKAVKVRFLEGFNSREVLDFNLYLSPEDVWVGAIADGKGFWAKEWNWDTGSFDDVEVAEGTPVLLVPDTSCTVPYLYDVQKNNGPGAAKNFAQPFLNIAYSDNGDPGSDIDFSDNYTQKIERAGEGHLEIIEMGTIVDVSGVADIATAVTHVDPTTGKNIGVPHDCDLLQELWTEAVDPLTGDTDLANSGQWVQESWGPDPAVNLNQEVTTGTEANSGGLFGGGAIVNSGNGTMYSYNAKAIDGFEGGAQNPNNPRDIYDGVHYRPGTIYPSLNSGAGMTANVFDDGMLVMNDYEYPVDAISAVFMHDKIMNEYTVEGDLGAGTEWVITFPTKNFYTDAARMTAEAIMWPTDPTTGDDLARPPFTQLIGATDDDGNALCEVVSIKLWDREEDSFTSTTNPGTTIPPTVSPSLPPSFDCSDFDNCPSYFQLCGEVNVLRFDGDNPNQKIFGTPTFGEDETLLVKIVDGFFDNGWGRINLAADARNSDPDFFRADSAATADTALVGLPVMGFAAYEFENDYLDDGVKAYYGGLFGHKTSVVTSAACAADADSCYNQDR